MNWDITELRLGKEASQLISRSSDGERTPDSRLIRFSIDEARALRPGIYVPQVRIPGVELVGSVAIRHLYRLLGFSEGHPFQWNLEHKLVQALVLNSFSPGSVPVTSGLNRWMAGNPGKSLTSRQLVKRAVASGSRPLRGPAAERVLRSIDQRGSNALGDAVTQEPWIVQEVLQVDREYRVHTLEQSVVDGLTFARHGDQLVGSADHVNNYVESVIAKLPAQMLGGTMCGWDVVLIAPNEYRVLEINFAGFHPVVGRGFQCSGFLAQPTWGPLLVAKMIRACEVKYGHVFRCDKFVSGADALGTFYWWVGQWLPLLQVLGSIDSLERVRCSTAHGELMDAMTPAYSEPQKLLDLLTRRVTRCGGVSA